MTPVASGPGALRGALVAGIALLLLEAAHADPKTMGPREWLAKMETATRSLNYIGTFVYRRGDRMESMRIIHRGAAAGEKARLVSLNGATREVLRDQAQVRCIQPHIQSIVIDRGRAQGALPRPFPRASASLGAHYRLSLEGRDRVANRQTRVVSVTPRDRYRYGLRLWLDEQTGLLLKSELRDEAGVAMEQILYTGIELPDAIPDALLEPVEPGVSHSPASVDAPSGGRAGWEAGWLPEGFRLARADQTPLPEISMPVRHLVYTDGLASFSVYIEPEVKGREYLEGGSRMGAVNAFGIARGVNRVTVVGEVPDATVRRVARAVRPRPGR